MKLAKLPFGKNEVILFFAFWLVYGMTINSANLTDYNLQQAGVEAMVERHHFYLEDSPTRELQGIGDTFLYQGHVYANKHPGQFMAGAVVYFFLRLLGFKYSNNYLLVSALVTFFSASLVMAAGGAAVYRLSEAFVAGRSRWWAIAAAIGSGFGTTVFPYSGIAHHDTIATGFLMIAFCLIFDLTKKVSSQRVTVTKAGFAGLLLGLTLTTSMLHFFMVVVVGIYFLSLRRWKLLLPLTVGGLVGLLPLLIYDAINFGNPFLLPAIANYKFTGYDPEVFFRFEWNNFVHKTNVYAEFINQYAAVLWLGVLGLFFLPVKYRKEKYFVLAAITVLFFYVANVQGLGTCGYGPRYLLPMMPFAALGISGISQLPRLWKGVVGFALIVAGLFSTVVNLVGALHGVMYCNLAKYAFPDYLAAIMRGEFRSFPLLLWLVPFVLLLVAAVLWQARPVTLKTLSRLPSAAR